MSRLRPNKLLVELSEACNTHQTHHRQRCRLCPNFDDCEPFCRDAIIALRNAIPKVEQALDSKPENIRQLCIFYQSVVGGIFCPQAPHLFDVGRKGVEILPRVRSLFQYALSMPEILVDIATAVSRLLSMIPEPDLQSAISLDLVYLIRALASLLPEPEESIEVSVFISADPALSLTIESHASLQNLLVVLLQVCRPEEDVRCFVQALHLMYPRARKALRAVVVQCLDRLVSEGYPPDVRHQITLLVIQLRPTVSSVRMLQRMDLRGVLPLLPLVAHQEDPQEDVHLTPALATSRLILRAVDSIPLLLSHTADLFASLSCAAVHIEAAKHVQDLLRDFVGVKGMLEHANEWASIADRPVKRARLDMQDSTLLLVEWKRLLERVEQATGKVRDASPGEIGELCSSVVTISSFLRILDTSTNELDSYVDLAKFVQEVVECLRSLMGRLAKIRSPTLALYCTARAISDASVESLAEATIPVLLVFDAMVFDGPCTNVDQVLSYRVTEKYHRFFRLSSDDPLESEADQFRRLEVLAVLDNPTFDLSAVHDDQTVLQKTLSVLAVPVSPNSSAVARQLRWLCTAWLFLPITVDDLRRSLARRDRISRVDLQGLVRLLLSTPFVDGDDALRRVVARQVRAVVSCSGFWELCKVLSPDEHAHAGQGVLFFLDDIISQHFTTPAPPRKSSPRRSRQSLSLETPSFLSQLSGVRCVATICSALLSSKPLSCEFLQPSFVRLMRIWSCASGPLRASCFGELSRLANDDFRVGVDVLGTVSFATAPLYEILTACASFLESDDKEVYFIHRILRHATAFLQALAPSTSSCCNEMRPRFDETEKLYDISLPRVFSHCVVDCNYGTMSAVTLLKRYLMKYRKNEASAMKRDPSHLDFLVGPFSVSSGASLAAWISGIDERTYQLCVRPGVFERVVPIVLLQAGKASLNFLAKRVLMEKQSLEALFCDREKFVLKELMWECGDPRYSSKSVKRALSTAARLRTRESSGEDQGANDVVTWTTSNLFYLLVNVVQTKWSSRTQDDRERAVRSLLVLLNNSRPVDLCQYVPQVLVTVNAAIGETTSNGVLSTLGVEVLSTLVTSIVSDDPATIGRFLTAIVVSLLPLFPWEQNAPSESFDATQKAVDLMEYLVGGNVGSSLKEYFRDIPFLPPSPCLDRTRASLRKLGVDLDSLLVSFGASTEHGESDTVSSLADGGSLSVDSRASTVVLRRALALQRRLATLFALAHNENVRVRRVVLHHIRMLLQSNRAVFHDLVEHEASVGTGRSLTTFYDGKSDGSTAVVAKLAQWLVARSSTEPDHEVQIEIATCLGEIGVLGTQMANRTSSTSLSFLRAGVSEIAQSYVLMHPPWLSRALRYGLRFVTNELVVAMKAAPSSLDQNKIAFSIQQLLHIVDSAARGEEISAQREDSNQEMSPWLSNALKKAGVDDFVSPFWSSEFHEVDAVYSRKPPFFAQAESYFAWISNWGRYMIQRSSEMNKTLWGDVFVSCRTAIRSSVGLSLAEDLLPILVLDRFCFSKDMHDQELVLLEMKSVLDVENSSNGSMSLVDRRKSVSAVFAILDTLQYWLDSETEKIGKRHHASTLADAESSRTAGTQSDDWPLETSLMCIGDLLGSIPLSLRARAAAVVGMQAKSLQYLELLSRQSVVGYVYGGEDPPTSGRPMKIHTPGSCTGDDLGLMKDVLVSLEDYDTMSAMVDESDIFAGDPVSRIRDSIRLHESSGDWEGALRDYDRAMQFRDEALVSYHAQRRGSVECMLELGQCQSVLNMIGTSGGNEVDRQKLLPCAVEAACRLGDWDSLASLVRKHEFSIESQPSDKYRVLKGKAILLIHEAKYAEASEAITNARRAVMEGLSSSAFDSFSRAHDHVVKLHALRDLEATTLYLAGQAHGSELRRLVVSWDRSVDIVPSLASGPVMSTRITAARLAGDVRLEMALLISAGRRARKVHDWRTAMDFLSRAEALSNRVSCGDTRSSLVLQTAKVCYGMGEVSRALKLLNVENVEQLATVDQPTVVDAATRHVRTMIQASGEMASEQEVGVFVRCILHSTMWMDEGGLKGSAEILDRFRVVYRVAPDWEQGHFKYAKFIDSVMRARVSAIARRYPERAVGIDEDFISTDAFRDDRICHRYAIDALRHYSVTLTLGSKHVYQALPRLLSLWFSFTAIGKDSKSGSKANDLRQSQEQANEAVTDKIRRIPSAAMYTAIPQLTSRLTHLDKTTASIVRQILRRILTKYPGQTMWSLAWLLQSKDPRRKSIGHAIFGEAEQALSSAKSKSYKVLVASKSLLTFLHALAKTKPKEKSKLSMRVKPWVGEVPLTEFVPPIQCALLVAVGSSGKEAFSRQLPRMRCFHPDITLMPSKERPKRIKVYAVPTDHCSPSLSMDAERIDEDCGEYHFLVKQEARGDLRKDARVQDLNNVINRLLVASDRSYDSRGRHHGLNLRTFAVTCLSEDTGLLEWVPNTASMRSLISKSYNPQAPPTSSRRRGNRLANFGDPLLRENFESKCQEMFFKNGDLKRAAVLFEKLCLKPNPPLLYWWFVHNFRDPQSWYEARTRFILSVAAWSAVGHVIGLGDRHSENILIDGQAGEVVHVDFDCIFDKGLHLPKPEIVPFRLTANMIDAFGPCGTDGLYSKGLNTTVHTLRENRDTLLSVLEPFVNDPVIDWKRQRSAQRASDAHNLQSMEAKRSIRVIDERLRGIYNLHNPNLKKVRRTDGVVDTQDDELAHLLPLSVDGQVQKMIAEATSSENLVQLYVGWMPWV